MQNFSKKNHLNLGQRIPYPAILSWNFKKLVEISTFKFDKLLTFSKKKKKKLLKLWSESPFYGYFLSRITKKSYIWNQHPQIFLTEKLHKKPKLPYFVTKNSWLVFFSPTKPYLGILGEELFRKVLSHLKTAPSNLPSCKILRKKNCLTWGPKMTYFQIFGLGFQNNSCHIWNQHPHICLIAKCHEKTINVTSWTKSSWLVAFDQECLTWMFERKI